MSVNSKMTAIADAIRAKTGGTSTLTLDQMATEIAGISGGGTLTVTAPPGVAVTVSKDGTSKTMTASNEGLAVFSGLESGTWVLSITDGEQTKSFPVVITTDYSTTIAFFTATINITYPAGSACTCSDGVTTFVAPDTSGTWACVVPNVGTWTITATLGEESTSENVEITEDGQTVLTELLFVKIYGISRDINAASPLWTRTDSAVGMTASASIGTSAGVSDFDNAMPWAGMVRETLSTNDVMVKIPKFYFQRYREGNIEYIKIADKEKEGFNLHPVFNHGGLESEYIYVGAYETSSGNKSVTGASPQVSQGRSTFRTNANNKGSGWGTIDIATLSAIQMLILVEFANNNAQSAIGRGYCDENGAAIKSGSCDSIPNLTGRPSGTNGKTGVVYRGIENFWGNVWEWIDGINFNSGTYYVCNDIYSYSDDTATGYEQLSFKGATSWSTSYITVEGLDSGNNTHIMLPSAAGSGSETTYVCDACWSNTGWRGYQHGGNWANGSACGPFTIALSNSSTQQLGYLGSRLIYIPS